MFALSESSRKGHGTPRALKTHRSKKEEDSPLTRQNRQGKEIKSKPEMSWQGKGKALEHVMHLVKMGWGEKDPLAWERPPQAGK